MQADYSKAALFRFIATAERQGLINANYAGAFRSAATKLLEDAGDGEDVRGTDVEAVTIRYHNKHPGELTPSSLATYQKRLRRVLQSFVSYTENPTTYKPHGRGASPKNSAENSVVKGKRAAAKPARPDGKPTTQTIEAPISASATSTSLAMNYPLRENFVAQVVLPRNMSNDEARKLCAFIRTLAVDFKPED